MISTADTTTKVCYDCLRELPFEQFRHRRKGSKARQGRCRTCYNAYMRQYRLRRRNKGLHRFATQLRREKNLDRAAALCAGMIVKFGGLDGFCTTWTEEIKAACREKPGSRFAVNSFFGIAQLIELLQSRRKPDPACLTDEELERELERELQKAVVGTAKTPV